MILKIWIMIGIQAALVPLPRFADSADIPPARSAPPVSRQFDLPALIELGLNHNPRLESKRLEAAAFEENYRASRPLDNPELELTWGKGETRESGLHRDIGGVAVRQSLENPFRRHFRIQARRLEWEAARHRVEVMENEIRAEIKKLAFRILYGGESLRLAEKHVESIERMFALILKRAESGEVKRLEALRLEVEALKARNLRQRARAALRIARDELNAYLGERLPPDFSVDGRLDSSPVSLDEAELAARSLNSHPLILERIAELDMAESLIRYERWGRLPGLDLSGFHNRELHGTVTGLGVSLEIPLWSRKSAEIDRAVRFQESEAAELRAARIELGRDVRSGVARLRLARETLDVFREGLLKQAEEGRRIAELAYRQGEISLIDYLDAQRSAFAVRQEYLDSLLDWSLERAELERTLGGGLK